MRKRLLVASSEQAVAIVADALANYDHSGDWWSAAYGRDDLDVNVWEDREFVHVTVYLYRLTINVLVTNTHQELAVVYKEA